MLSNKSKYFEFQSAVVLLCSLSLKIDYLEYGFCHCQINWHCFSIAALIKYDHGHSQEHWMSLSLMLVLSLVNQRFTIEYFLPHLLSPATKR